MGNAPIYLDYAATTPLDPRVLEAMQAALSAAGGWANPASNHWAGRAARQLVADARGRLAGQLGANPAEIVFTSGATESDNLAIRGLAAARRDRGRHFVTARTEHKAVIDSCAALERAGFEVTYLDPQDDGLLEPDQVAQALRDDTIGVSVMLVNNEIGVIQDIQAIGDLCRSRNVPLHVDAAQALAWLDVDLGRLPVDLMSITAHKLCGPKGIGALFVREGTVIEPLLFGGEQERGLRPGTLAPHQIVGLARAVELAGEAGERDHLAALGQQLRAGLLAIPEVRLNGHPERRVPHIINVAFAGICGEALRFALSDVAVSAGAACSADSPDGSYVLRSLGLGDGLAQSSLRFSLGRFTTATEVDRALAEVRVAQAQLGSWSVGAPEWFRR